MFNEKSIVLENFLKILPKSQAESYATELPIEKMCIPFIFSRIDHLERKSPRENTTWQRPIRDDVQSAEEVQILPIPVQGDWDFTTDRPHFELSNADDIVHNYQKICKLFNLAICE